MERSGAAEVALAIDLGTSNTVAVMRWPDGRTRPVLFDGQNLMPSAVFLDEWGQLHAGWDSYRLSQSDPARYEPNPKRRIDEQTVLLGGSEVATADLLAAVLAQVAAAASSAAGALPTAVLTYPAAWGGPRRQVLVNAAARAGWRTVHLVPEPVAAVRYFTDVLRHPVPVGGICAVFDFGGGTLDIAVIRNDRTAFTVIGSGGVADLGGLDIDAAIVEHIGALVAQRSPEAWERIQRPTTASEWRNRWLFWNDVRGAKETLSRRTMAPVPVPGVEGSVHVTRDELERLAGPILRRGVHEAAGVIRECGVEPRNLSGLFLVGGSSRVPLVARLLHVELGIAPTVLEQPELPVAEGALAEAIAQGVFVTGPRYPREADTGGTTPVSGVPVSGPFGGWSAGGPVSGVPGPGGTGYLPGQTGPAPVSGAGGYPPGQGGPAPVSGAGGYPPPGQGGAQPVSGAAAASASYATEATGGVPGGVGGPGSYAPDGAGFATGEPDSGGFASGGGYATGLTPATGGFAGGPVSESVTPPEGYAAGPVSGAGYATGSGPASAPVSGMPGVGGVAPVSGPAMGGAAAPVSGVPTSGAPRSGGPVAMPVSGVPTSGAPVSGVPVSGIPTSGAGPIVGAAQVGVAPVHTPGADQDPDEVPPGERSGRRGWIAGIAGALVLLLVGAIGLVWFLNRDGGDGGTDKPAFAWQSLAPLPIKLEGAAVAAFDKKLWVIGGIAAEDPRPLLTDVYVYDPATDTWANGPKLPVQVGFTTAAATDKALYVVGGQVLDGSTDKVWRLDSPTGTWVEDVKLPEPRSVGTVAYSGGRLIYAGGTARDGKTRADVWELRPGADKWTTVGQLHQPREKLTAFVDPAYSVTFVGGAARESDGVADRYATKTDIVDDRGGVRVGGSFPAVNGGAAVFIEGYGFCTIGGENAEKTVYTGLTCENPIGDKPNPQLRRPRLGLGVAKINGVIYAVGGYGRGFNGSSDLEALREPQ
ncbi:hypothetical protein Val02_59580 [Virgisporangium aliadipatigenens]|uniref:Hsp70 family protein n=1 Tax=Virgisporangium aliadipatigenens TaxID=741659 RepID=A0A8J3YRB6_9ACTN|nr:Hsp70 family protein [Virgisporangium aliadipatigenens]GIJ49072.1 hypothetical protein Val02_59580 [Virgisporangium aliadipatigenens]